MKNFDTKMIYRAAKLCSIPTRTEPERRHRVAAILIDSYGNILSVGTNSYKKTHTLQAYYANQTSRSARIYLHAEISALVKNSTNKQPHTIYVARLYKNGDYALAKPCDLCELAIEEAGIKRVIYTTHLGVKELKL